MTLDVAAEAECHKVKEFVDKQSCCSRVVETWRAKQPRWREQESAKAKAVAAPSTVNAGLASAAALRYERSGTQKLFTTMMRRCINGNKPFEIPKSLKISQLRERAEKALHAAVGEYEAKSAEHRSASLVAKAATAAYLRISKRVQSGEAQGALQEVQKEESAEATQGAKDSVAIATQSVADAAGSLASAEEAVNTQQKEVEDKKKLVDDKTEERNGKLAEFDDQNAPNKEQLAEKKGALEDAEKALAAAEEDEDDEDSAGKVKEASDAVEAAKAAVTPIQEEVDKVEGERSDYATSSGTELSAVENGLATAQRALRKAKAAAHMAKIAHGKAEATLAKRKTELDQALKVEAQTNIMLKEAKANNADGTVMVAALKAKADAAAVAATKALRAMGPAKEQVKSLKGNLEQTVVAEEHALAKQEMQLKDPAAEARDDTVRGATAATAAMHDSYAKTAACISDGEWVC